MARYKKQHEESSRFYPKKIPEAFVAPVFDHKLKKKFSSIVQYSQPIVNITLLANE